MLLEAQWRDLSGKECIAVWKALKKSNLKAKPTKLTESNWLETKHARQRQKILLDIGTQIRQWSLGEGVPEAVYDNLAANSPDILLRLRQKFRLRRKGSSAEHDDTSSSSADGKLNAC